MPTSRAIGFALVAVCILSTATAFAPSSLQGPAQIAFQQQRSFRTANAVSPLIIKPTSNAVVASPTALFYGEVRGVDAQLLFDTWEWTANLGAPAALVAGAVLATMVEGREDMSPKKSDRFIVRLAKKLTRFLLLTSFGLEIISIFVTTVTGTMLLSHGDASQLVNLNFNSPMGFLQHNWEFEYLTSRITFLQGLFHWLASVAIDLLIPKEKEGVSAKRMNKFTSSALMTILVGMLSFLNRHMTFYKNYWGMWKRYSVVAFKMFLWPLRPLTMILVPMTVVTCVLGVRAFATTAEEEEDDIVEGASSTN